MGFSSVIPVTEVVKGCLVGETMWAAVVDEESPSTLFSEVLSRANATRVIMWLIPIEEYRANAFWKKFSFPPYVQVSFSSSGP